MSKSYKKTPIGKDCGYHKKGKKFANRRVRALNENELCSRGSLYKRYYESWNIVDYISRWTKEDAIEYYKKKEIAFEHNKEDKSLKNFFKEYPTLEAYLDKMWERYYRRK